MLRIFKASSPVTKFLLSAGKRHSLELRNKRHTNNVFSVSTLIITFINRNSYMQLTKLLHFFTFAQRKIVLILYCSLITARNSNLTFILKLSDAIELSVKLLHACKNFDIS